MADKENVENVEVSGLSKNEEKTNNEEKPPTLSDQVRSLLATEITNQNIALNVLVGFVGIAQRRGAFAIDESAKLFECIKSFRGESK